MITLIWAQDKNGSIGKDNSMPWHIPADLAFFKKQTLNKTVVMGRKTYVSLGKALPQRKNVVLTRDDSLVLPDAEVVNDVKTLVQKSRTEDLMICGGAEIYQLFLHNADQLIVTQIDAVFDADTHFPEVDWSLFYEVKREHLVRGEKSSYDLDFITYQRKRAL
ncbi:dihydrofolate reductase [Listeria sp. PSOL-1]|uniref:dihydrofolate reductase n=1 Tax=Listeria sp. PSOL-1 TaxID=1844999 RepID=UPI0013CF83D1|nr:dihydrofolate reductase [Listeria sp. PSOL-1]